jgi:hypothetical protein
MQTKRRSRSTETGQLLLPMLGLFMFFAVFLGLYLRWCRNVYWQMRMDIAAEAVALSAARAQAGMLNNLASAQMAGNLAFQKVEVMGNDVAHMQVAALPGFLAYWVTVRGFTKGYVQQTILVANTVAKANRADIHPLPWPRPQSRLIPRNVTMKLFSGIYYSGSQEYNGVYYQRSWGGGFRNPQPIHENAWVVAHHGIVGIASARLWLDVSPSDPIANGGFPRPNGGSLEGLGVQCFYPHFNARLTPTSPLAQQALMRLVKAFSHP